MPKTHKNMTYQSFDFDKFELFYKFKNKYSLFELSIDWLQATVKHTGKRSSLISVHCLLHDDKIIVAWPLVRQKTGHVINLQSLTSFYSSVSEPFFDLPNYHQRHLEILFREVCAHNPWDKLTLGPLEFINYSALEKGKYNKYSKIYSETDNWYEDDIQSFQQYYDERPSRLKNTIKRREKQLIKKHKHHIKIVTCKKEFDLFFPCYKAIYEKSWKGEEYSYDFIELVCLQAINENRLRFGLIIVDNVAVAAQIWFLQRGTASIFKLAYDPLYQKFSVGSILSMALSQHVIDVDKIHTIEFGMGNEPYKKDWMSKCNKRITLQIFNHKTMIGNFLAFRYIALSKIKGWMLAKIAKFSARD